MTRVYAAIIAILALVGIDAIIALGNWWLNAEPFLPAFVRGLGLLGLLLLVLFAGIILLGALLGFLLGDP